MFSFRCPLAGAHWKACAPIMLLAVLSLGGCSSADSSPTAYARSNQPALPDLAALHFDFGYFEAASVEGKGTGQTDNFTNAYVRAMVLESTANQVVAAPVSAFSAAAQTFPVAHGNGSYVWVYNWRHGSRTLPLILRGQPVGDMVQWELSLVPGTSHGNVPWLTGITKEDGSEGHWTIKDLADNGSSVSGEIAWGRESGGTYLEFVSRDPGSEGASLRFTNNDPDFRIEFSPGPQDDLSYIRWHASGAGSLRVPDYNGGKEAGWDSGLRNVD